MRTTPVGSFPANAFGLYDMHGNVWQWCQDWYGDYPQKDVIEPQGPDTGTRRVLRGGSFFYQAFQLRSANRLAIVPTLRLDYLGFRVARTFTADDAKQGTPPVKETADPPPVIDGKLIAALIGRLGSTKFQERAAAQKQLEALGSPALGPLKKAMQTGNLEMSLRAGELVRKIEEREFHAAMLAPRRVRLRVADLPVVEAVAELAKASGYAIRVDGIPSNPGKKVTLDTGDVTFWEAFDKLCAQAGLKMLAANAKNQNRVSYASKPVAITAATITLVPRRAEEGAPELMWEAFAFGCTPCQKKCRRITS